ncbi:MAG TPA: PQQ-binding-like beta-propeller repeat protein [Candidatus Limnocylindria bacterium]|nr:PQQ-binding-like beta-propeller repeat protein [Candidatus Limnocylindria bacterium]
MKLLALLLTAFAATAADTNWGTYLGDKASSHYSTLRQITPKNVTRLEVAWTYNSGGTDANNRSQIQCNPLIVDGVLYGTSPDLQAFALDAATGRELWRFDPAALKGFTKSGVNRGLVHWAGGAEHRIFYGNDHFLHCLDARTGLRVASFGNGGTIDLKADLGRDVSSLALQATTPGVIFGDLLIMGMRLGEGPAPAAPGHIRAYNVRTGKLVWRFNTIPQPGEPGYETWPPNAYTYIGGVNVWTGFALDERRGLVFCPTGSAAFDFWGGNRLGDDLYANCLIALDAKTGRRVWHQQLVRHDLWDRDLPAPPNLLTVTHDGHKVDAVAQVTKSGHVFVFNRETGEPLFPLREVAVPKSDLQGEAAAPSQRLPTRPAPFTRELFTANEITDISPEAHRQVLDRFVKLRPHALFLPPSREGTIIFPGFDGGAEWGGAAADPEGILYVNANEMPWVLNMVETRQTGGQPLSSGEAIFNQICAACHGIDRNGNKAQNVPSLVGVAQRLKKPDVLALLKTGKGVMPSFDFLSEPQRQAVVDHLFGTTPPAKPANDPGRKEELGGEDALGNIPYTMTGYNRWLDTNGYPAIKPPWGTLNAIDLNTGEYRWRVTLGEWPELTARGIPPTGTENYGGPVVTAGGLIFIAASRDEHIRAFDRRTGKELWKSKLPAAGYATPATYSAGGRQYVVIACGGGKIGTRSGDAYVAFRLPK